MSSSPWRNPYLWNHEPKLSIHCMALGRVLYHSNKKTKALYIVGSLILWAQAHSQQQFFFVAVWTGSDTRVSSTTHSVVFFVLENIREHSALHLATILNSSTTSKTDVMVKKKKSSVKGCNFTCFILFPKSKFYARMNAQKCIYQGKHLLCARHQPSHHPPHTSQPSFPTPFHPSLHIPHHGGPRTWC